MRTPTRKSECRRTVHEYIQQHDPYKGTVPLGYNIAAMSRYARKKNLPISKLTPQETAMFANNTSNLTK